MNYLTVKPITVKASGQNNLAELKIVPDGTMVDAECLIWALRDGNQVLNTYGKLIGQMKPFYLHGNLENGAVYVMEHEDLCKVVTAILGPSDQARAVQGHFDLQQAMSKRRAERSALRANAIADTCLGLLKIIGVVLLGIGRVIFGMIMTLIFIRWMHRNRR